MHIYLVLLINNCTVLSRNVYIMTFEYNTYIYGWLHV